MADDRPRISFALTKEERAAFRLACVRAGVPMSEVLRSAAAAFVKEEGEEQEFRTAYPNVDLPGPMIIEFEVANSAGEQEEGQDAR